MELNEIRTIRYNAVLKSYLKVVLAVVLLYGIVLTPANLLVNSNVLLLQTVLPLLVDFLMLFCNFFFYWISFAYLLYTVYRFGFGESKGFLIRYGAVVCGRYLLNLLAGYCTMGFPKVGGFLSNDLLWLLIDIVMDLALQMGGALLIVHKAFQRESASLPTVKLFDFQNSLLKTAFLICIIPSAVSFLSRLIYDAIVGFPQNAVDLLWMISYYILDLFSLLIGYLVVVFLLTHLHTRNVD